jgi:hypothetical protein
MQYIIPRYLDYLKPEVQDSVLRRFNAIEKRRDELWLNSVVAENERKLYLAEQYARLIEFNPDETHKEAAKRLKNTVGAYIPGEIINLAVKVLRINHTF